MELLYRDDHMAAVHKPAGLLVHRSRIDKAETAFALQQARALLGQRVYPVHRLDKPTSGVLLFALDPVTARKIGGQFTNGEVQKRYLAIVRGYVQPEGVIDYALREEADPTMGPGSDHQKVPQQAITRYQRLARFELPHPVGRYATARFSLVDVTPRTGRRHQIRRHLKHIDHPIIGDTTHGDGRQNQFFREHFASRRLLLAATSLRLAHPVTGMSLEIAAAPAPDFTAALDALQGGLQSGG